MSETVLFVSRHMKRRSDNLARLYRFPKTVFTEKSYDNTLGKVKQVSINSRVKVSPNHKRYLYA